LAISLQEIAIKPVYINVFRDDVLAALAETYDLWQNKGFAPIRAAWLKQAHGLNEPMTVRLPNETFKGTFDGVDETGALLVLLEDGSQKTVQAGEVHFGNGA
jgi:BirA family biotin operon repressor/biotin-[acetyl-CoA-carboxylase] ligase